MRVEEERVHSPGERLGASVQVVVQGCLGELSAVLVLDVFDVCSVLNFSVVDPSNADGDWEIHYKDVLRAARHYSRTY